MRTWVVVGVAATFLSGVIGCSPSERGPSTAAQGASSGRTPVSGTTGTTGTTGGSGAQAQPVIRVVEESARVPTPQAGQKKVVLEQLGMT